LWLATHKNGQCCSQGSGQRRRRSGQGLLFREDPECKFFINRITGLVPAKLENIKVDEQSAMNISEEAFAV